MNCGNGLLPPLLISSQRFFCSNQLINSHVGIRCLLISTLPQLFSAFDSLLDPLRLLIVLQIALSLVWIEQNSSCVNASLVNAVVVLVKGILACYEGGNKRLVRLMLLQLLIKMAYNEVH